jgi:perosamine synthetase
MIGHQVAPAGAPIRGGDIVRWCRRWTRLAVSSEELRAAICSGLNRRHCFLICTGRAGLTVLLSALKSLAPPHRDEVVLPSYTCYSVAASALRAGLRVRIVDIEARTLDFDLERLGNVNFQRVLAIVPTNLYGMPGRLREIAEIARDRGVFLVDDAAQSLGASLHGVPAGAWGDAGLLSFDKGKALSAIDGGAVVTDSSAVADVVGNQLRTLHRQGVSTSIEHASKVLAYAACLRPSMYWIPNAVPGLGLGLTQYDPDFVIQRESPWLAALAATMWPRLDEFTAARITNAGRYRAALPDTPLLAMVEPVDGARPSYLRFPVLVKDAPLRSRLLRDLVNAGIGATGSYPGSIADIPAVQAQFSSPPDARAGREVAASIVTLPTHPYVSGRDIECTVDILLKSVGGRS